MSTVDTRQLSRDSLFVMAKVKVEGDAASTEHTIKVRNLSPGGLMAEGKVKVTRGTLVNVDLRNLGWVEGTVAWKQDDRFGIAFLEDIDPKQARSQSPQGESESATPRFVRPPVKSHVVEPSKLRKI